MAKTEVTREQKAPKTIQVKTVVISVFMLVELFVTFLAGWFGHIEYQYKVQSDAAQLVQDLKINGRQ